MCACTYCHALQIRAPGDDENLAEWVVEVTSAAERQGSDRFVTGYAQCVPCLTMRLCGQTFRCPMHVLGQTHLAFKADHSTVHVS